MSNPKKTFNLWRYAFYNIGLGFLTLLFPFIFIHNIYYAIAYQFVLSTVASLNALNMNKKSILTSLLNLFATSEDEKADKFSTKRIEKKEFPFTKGLIAVAVSIVLFHIFSVLFGAPIFEVYTDTLYFSVLMTMLTSYPLMWHFFHSESLCALLKVVSDSKFDNLTDSYFHSVIYWTLFGAWIGAFPIPLDWDRPWQKWPTTCCLAAVLAHGSVHLFIGFRLLFGLFRDRRKITVNRSV